MRYAHVHRHPCQSCGVKTECEGNLERNYDGWPEVMCSAFHDETAEFFCEACAEKKEKERHDDEDDEDAAAAAE